MGRADPGIFLFLGELKRKFIKKVVGKKTELGMVPSGFVLKFSMLLSVGGWVYYFFIYLFVCWCNRMTALFLCYHSTALRTSKRDVSASAICFLSLEVYILLYREPFISSSYYFGRLSCSLHFFLLPLLHHAHSQRLGGS